jgi:hypothetical protein
MVNKTGVVLKNINYAVMTIDILSDYDEEEVRYDDNVKIHVIFSFYNYHSFRVLLTFI